MTTPRMYRYLRIFLQGVAEPVCLPITDEDNERLETSIQADEWEDGPCRMFQLGRSGLMAFLNLKCVQAMHSLWQCDPSPHEDGWAQFDVVRLYFHGRAAPLECSAAEPIEVYDVVYFLAAYQPSFEGFLSFLDEDGERVAFRPDQLMLLVVPKWIMDEGEAQADEEEETAAEEPAETATAGSDSVERAASDRSGGQRASATKKRARRSPRPRPARGLSVGDR